MTELASSGQDGTDQEGIVNRAANLLGGQPIFKRRLTTTLDAHEAILSGFPGRALVHLAGNVAIIRHADTFEKALGMSLRTFQRHKKDAAPRALSQEQSGRAWKFAEILEKAAAVFGSQAEAEAFLDRPAFGLTLNKPIDLLATPAGVDLVETHLERIRYGVYA